MFMNIKRLFLLLFGTLMLSAAYAQMKQPAGMRVEVAEAETDNGDYSIFTYMDSDAADSFGYFLSLGRVTDFLGSTEILGMEVKNIHEVIVCLGSTTDEALATIGSMLDLYDEDVNTSVEFKSRAAGPSQLGDPVNSTCVVVKKPLGGKRLQFLFPSGEHQARCYLPKSVLKELRMNFKLDIKLHPKQHRKQ